MEVSSENNKDVNYFKNFKYALKFAGVSLNGYGSLLYKFYSCIVLSSTLLYGAILYIEIFNQSLDTLMDSLFIQFSISLAMAKALLLFLKREKLQRIMQALQNKPFLPNPERGGDVEERLIKECVWVTNMQNKVYWSGGAISITFSILIALVKRVKSNDYHDWQLPYSPITVLDITHSPNFEIVCVYQVINMIYYAAYFLGSDLIIAAMLTHLSYQFKVLKNNIKNIIRLSYQQMMKETNKLELNNIYHESIDASLITWTYLKRNLKDAVKYHLEIIKVSKELENLFNGLFLVIFLCTLGMNALLVYHLSMIPLSDNRIYPAALQLVCIILQILIICYWGEQVLNESQLVGDSAFEMNFSGADVRFQKALILIIRRCQNPVAVTAKKFTVVSLYVFTWILQKSYAAYIVLQNSKNK